ncbi:hypothetical protein GCM10020227_68740 [Streptomyces flavovirens]
MAQKTAVGRGTSPSKRAPASRPAATSQAVGGDLHERLRVEPGLREGREGPLAAVPDLVQVVGAAHIGDGAVARRDEVADGQHAAAYVVHADRAVLGARRHPVDQDVGDAVAGERLQVAAGGVGRGDQDAADPLLGEEAEVFGLLLLALVAVADHDAEAGLAGGAFGAAGDVHEEGVAHVQDEQRHDAAAAGPELPGRLAAYVAELLDRREDPGAGVRQHRLGAVDHVGDRADRDPGPPGHVLDSRHTPHLPCPTDASGRRAACPSRPDGARAVRRVRGPSAGEGVN